MEAVGRTKSKVRKMDTRLEVLSKEVAKIFDDANHNWNIENLSQRTGRQRFSRRGSTNLAAGVAPEEKDMCFSSMYQGEGVHSTLKARPTDPSRLTGLEVGGYRGRTDRKVVVG